MTQQDRLATTDTITCAANLGGTPVTLSCHVVEHNIFRVAKRRTYPHPTPPFNRIFCFITGGCHVETSTARVMLTPGHVYLLPIHQSFDGTFADNTELLYFHVRTELFPGHDLFSGLTSVCELADVAGMLAPWYAAYRTPGMPSALYWRSLLFHMISRFLDSEPAAQHIAQRVQGHVPWHSELLAFIHQHGTPAVTVEECAAYLGLSSAVVSKTFRRDMGLTLKTYLQQYFLERACHLLCMSEMSIKEITHEIGYDDLCYFHRIFKKYTGQTPREYRRQFRDIQANR